MPPLSLPIPIPAGPSSSRDPMAAEYKRQSSLAYMHVLEREHLTCAWRAVYYPRNRDCDYHRRVANLKQEMILTIAAKLDVPCLFTDPLWRAEVEASMHLNTGYPLLHYKDFRDRTAYEATDLRAYYRPCTDVRLIHDGRTRTARILNLQLLVGQGTSPLPLVRVRIDHGPVVEVDPKTLTRL